MAAKGTAHEAANRPMATAVVFAYNQFGAEGLRACLAAGLTVTKVFTHADSPTEHIWWESVAKIAEAHAIPVVLDPAPKDPALPALVGQVDFLFSFYFRHLLPEAVLACAQRGAYNLHGSLLPAYRGRAPVNWQLVHGERTSGLTLHGMVARADAGAIVAQQAVSVHPDQDALGLTRQLVAICPEFLATAITDLIVGRAEQRPMEVSKGSCFAGRKPADGRIDLKWPARRCHDLVRAVAPPWPGASAWVGGRELRIFRTAVVTDAGIHPAPGTVLEDGTVACGSGRLGLLHTAWADNGRPADLRVGMILE